MGIFGKTNFIKAVGIVKQVFECTNTTKVRLLAKMVANDRIWHCSHLGTTHPFIVVTSNNIPSIIQTQLLSLKKQNFIQRCKIMHVISHSVA